MNSRLSRDKMIKLSRDNEVIKGFSGIKKIHRFQMIVKGYDISGVNKVAIWQTSLARVDDAAVWGGASGNL